VVDQRITPVFLDDAARVLLGLAAAGAQGIVHVAAASWTTPYELALAIARRLRLDTGLVQPVRFDEFSRQRPAPRPQNSWLDVSLCRQLLGPSSLRSMDAQLDGWAEQLQAVAGPAG
jgi:dTDP-4-dehydrorhamnose reductase